MLIGSESELEQPEVLARAGAKGDGVEWLSPAMDTDTWSPRKTTVSAVGVEGLSPPVHPAQWPTAAESADAMGASDSSQVVQPSEGEDGVNDGRGGVGARRVEPRQEGLSS